MTPDDVTQVSIPATLGAEIEAAADEERRPATELVRDALEAYLEGRRWRLDAEQELARARELGLPDDDVPLTSEYRCAIQAKIADGVRSLREGRGTDGEAFFARMEAEFNEVERQGHK